MITATRELQGRMLIGLNDGRTLGEIKDFCLDGNARTIAALFLGTEGLINRRYVVVSQSKVQLMGVDAARDARRAPTDSARCNYQPQE